MSYKDNILEKSLKEFPDMVTLKKTETILDQIKNCIFKIYTSEGSHGTGFFCLIYDEIAQKNIKVMISNNHIIGDDYLNNNKTIKISMNNGKKIMDIKLDSSRKKYTNKKYDVTIIEIKENDKIKDNSFLQIDENIYQDNPKDFFEKKSIYIIQYPDYLEASVSYGILKRIKENNDLEHYCITKDGSSGSPIINLENNKVLGVHKCGSVKCNFNMGAFLKNPINEYISKNNISISINNLLSNYSKDINESDTHLDSLKLNKPKIEFKFLIVGLDNSGKTALFKYLTKQDYKDTRPTPGVNVKNIQIESYKFDLYDLGGLKAIRDYWCYYYENVDALIYVVDTSDKERIQESYEVCQGLLKEKNLLGIPFLFFANKSDLSDSLGPDKIIENLKICDIEGRPWALYSCSFLKCTGIKDGIKWLLDQLNLENAFIKYFIS